MDPVTIIAAIAQSASAAKVAWDFGEAVYHFLQNTQRADKTAEDLAASVKAFGDTCDLVGTSLKSLEEAYQRYGGSLESLRTSDDELLWRGVCARLEECQSIVKELSGVIPAVPKQQPAYMAQAWRQFKLNLQMERIASVESRLSRHTSTLMLSLQAIKM